jgi:hypothetical protein
VSSKPDIHFPEDKVLAYIQGRSALARSLYDDVRNQAATFIERPGESLYTEDVYRPGFQFGCKEETRVTIIADHILDVLFDFTEAAYGLIELNKTYSRVIHAFSENFRSWKHMRHDLRHRFDRIFRDHNEKRKFNDAFVDGCQGFWAAHYSIGRDMFVTGLSPEGRLCLGTAVHRADECCVELHA